MTSPVYSPRLKYGIDTLKDTFALFQSTRCEKKQREIMDIIMWMSRELINSPEFRKEVSPVSQDNFKETAIRKLNEASWYLTNYQSHHKAITGKTNAIHPNGHNKYGKLRSAL